jgi:hypothetical protein
MAETNHSIIFCPAILPSLLSVASPAPRGSLPLSRQFSLHWIDRNHNLISASRHFQNEGASIHPGLRIKVYFCSFTLNTREDYVNTEMLAFGSNIFTMLLIWETVSIVTPTIFLERINEVLHGTPLSVKRRTDRWLLICRGGQSISLQRVCLGSLLHF